MQFSMLTKFPIIGGNVNLSVFSISVSTLNSSDVFRIDWCNTLTLLNATAVSTSSKQVNNFENYVLTCYRCLKSDFYFFRIDTSTISSSISSIVFSSIVKLFLVELLINYVGN